jgi:Homeodomain-like domain-containing protein
MHSTEQMNRFIELRAQGLPVPRIAEQLGIPASTLYDWNEAGRDQIQRLKLALLEQVEERVLGAHQSQVETLARSLKLIDDEIASDIAKSVRHQPVHQLIRMAASLRRQLRSFHNPPCAPRERSASSSHHIFFNSRPQDSGAPNPKP